MENNNKESGKPHETVTLVLKEERFQVEKKKLIDKSLYFAVLLVSPNFVDYSQTEHFINYNISPMLLQEFINWIHYDRIAFITSETSNDFEELLILLELSILFAADNLMEDINKILESHFMSPKYSIDILLLAQELNINVLHDLSLAVCLDRFDELPLNSILELSRENFLKIIGNINLSTYSSSLCHIIQHWMDHNRDFTIPLNILWDKQETKILHSIIANQYNDDEQFIHCWDDNDFFELTSFKYPTDIRENCYSTGKKLEGMQITARKYDLYLCGGEYGIGSGKFNNNVWRYSLISKTWFLETVMPVERRHMITVFFKNKLLLVGGVGRNWNRRKLETVDVYDIYTGMWTSGAKMPKHFNSDVKHLIFKNQLIIHEFTPTIYIYFPGENVWERKIVQGSEWYTLDVVPILTPKTTPCYIDIIDQDNMILKTITETSNAKECDCLLKTFSRSLLIGTKYRDYEFCNMLQTKCHHNPNFFRLIPFFYEYNKPAAVLLTDDDLYLEELYLRCIPIRNPEKFSSLLSTQRNPFSKFFNLFHPAHLHTTNLDHI